MLRIPAHIPLAAAALAILLGADAYGRHLPTAPVPDLVGRRFEEASRELAAAGFGTTFRASNSGEGIRVIVDQHPVGGSRARLGSQVRLTWRWVSFGGAGAAPPSAFGGAGRAGTLRHLPLAIRKKH